MRWIAGPWEHCSATCGSLGRQMRQISCVSVSRNKLRVTHTFGAISDNRLDDLTRDLSSSTSPPSDNATALALNAFQENHWVGDDPEVPSNVLREQFPTVGLDYVDPALCRGEREPPNERPCNRAPCPGYWKPQGWTEVSCV